MSVPEFPMYLAKLNVKVLQSLLFTMPEQEIGRDDIQIFVEYAIPDDKSMVVYTAWAQFTDAAIRAMVYDGVVPFKDEDSVITDIITELNMADKFHETVQRFVEHFDR